NSRNAPRFMMASRSVVTAWRSVKKYFFRWSPVSKISDHEDAGTALQEPEMSRVENPVGEPIPAVSHFPEDGSKDPSAFNRQHTRDVFPDEPLRFFVSEDFDVFKGKVSSLVFEALPAPRQGKCLARGPAHQQVDPGVNERPVVQEPRHVPE